MIATSPVIAWKIPARVRMLPAKIAPPVAHPDGSFPRWLSDRVAMCTTFSVTAGNPPASSGGPVIRGDVERAHAVEQLGVAGEVEPLPVGRDDEPDSVVIASGREQ